MAELTQCDVCKNMIDLKMNSFVGMISQEQTSKGATVAYTYSYHTDCVPQIVLDFWNGQMTPEEIEGYEKAKNANV